MKASLAISCCYGGWRMYWLGYCCGEKRRMMCRCHHPEVLTQPSLGDFPPCSFLAPLE